jgi:signal transduction histidine kinase
MARHDRHLVAITELGLTEANNWRRHSALERAARDAGLPLSSDQRDQVARDQLRMVLLHTRVGTVAATAFAVLLAMQMQSVLPGLQVQLWLGLKVVVAMGRILLAQAYRAWGQDSPHHARWDHAMLGLLALDGLIWGLAGWRLAGHDVTVAALGVAALDGVSCVATFGLQVRLAATAAYVVPILLPMAAALALRSDEVAHFASIGQLILLVLLLATSRATSRRLVVGMLLQQHANRLMADKDAALRLAHERSAERDRFLAKVSHELRTPLHGILGVTNLLRQAASDPTALRRLGLIETSGLHLQGLINDLLDASVIQAGQFTLHDADFDLTELIDQVAEVFAMRAAGKGLQFELRNPLPHPCWVHGDGARLSQVLHNLLGNAVKFTERGSIWLSVAPEAAPGRMRLSVRDTGPGMSPEEREQVFQPFHQAGSGHMADGVGLGLTIAREIAIAMGGDVTVHSAPGEGATFEVVVRLPAVPAPVRAPVQSSPHVSGPDASLPAQVLVAEDDEVNAMIVSALLDTLGVRHERVVDGQQAVARALREDDRPDMVLMDCRMPVMDGLAATAEIRLQEQQRGLPRLPILALTAAHADADRAACMTAGMDRVIGKPFTREQLVQALRDAALPRTPPTTSTAHA